MTAPHRKSDFARLLVLPVLLAAFAVAGCGGGGSSDEPAGSTGSENAQSQPTSQSGAFTPPFTEVKKDKGPVFSEGCLITGGQPESGECAYGNVDSTKKVVVLGDSHALQWTPALIEVAKNRDWRLINLLHANCTAAQVSVNEDCDLWRENALERIAEEKPGLVIVASNTGPNMTVQDGGTTLGREDAEPLLEAGMVDTFNDLKATGAEVTLMQDMAMSKDYLPSECVAENRDDPGKCTFKMDRPPELAYDLKAADQVGGIQVIDPIPRICPNYTCEPVEGNILKFRDRFHISATYSKQLAKWLESELQNPW